MFDSQVMEVAAGLILIYLIASTVCSSLKELIAKALDLRATTLESAIGKMLADPDNTLTKTLLSNHLIASTAPSGTKPPYISSRNFALALFDVIAPAKANQPRTIDDLRTGASNLPEPLRSTLLTLIDSAHQDGEVARQRVENWYDDMMERVSGAYKRRAQVYIALLGVLLCTVLNVDTLMIVRELWNDQAIRTAIAKQAEERVTQNQSAKDCAGDLQCTADSIRQANVPPIGWASEGFRARPHDIGWLWKALGILISSIAVALGAPFWFDLLNKFVNLRLTGDPPPDSRQSATP